MSIMRLRAGEPQCFERWMSDLSETNQQPAGRRLVEGAVLTRCLSMLVQWIGRPFTRLFRKSTRRLMRICFTLAISAATGAVLPNQRFRTVQLSVLPAQCRTGASTSGSLHGRTPWQITVRACRLTWSTCLGLCLDVVVVIEEEESLQ